MEWKEVRLGDVCDLIAGFAFKAKDFGEFPTKVIKIGDIKPPFVDYVGQVGVDISNYDINRLSKYTVKYGDYVLAMTGATIGKVGKYISENFSYINQRVLKFSPKQNVDADFINYIICSNIFAKYVVNFVDSESAQPNISAPTISKFAFQIPSEKDDQHRIASILSSLDRKIELNNKINTDLEEMAQAIFKNWFVDFEPFKDGKFVDSELGMIPEGWKVGTLFDIAEIFDKKRKPLSGNVREKMDKIYPYYGATSCMDYVDDYIFDGIYTLIGEDGSVVKENGLPYMQYVWGKMWVNNHAHILQGKNGYSTEMIHALLSITNIKFLVTGAVQAKLSQGNMQKILVAIPPKNILDEIRPVIDNLYSKIRINTDENSRLSLLRDTLLPRLMSGEIEVPE